MHSSYQVAGKKADPGTAQRVALIAWSICISLIFAATVLRFLEGGNLLQYAHNIFIGIAFGLYGTVGALIVWQRPRNTIGWILCAIGIGTAITDFSGAYSAYGMIKGHLLLPGTEVFNWLAHKLGFVPCISATPLPQRPSTHTTLAHRRMAGSSSGVSLHAGWLAIPCERGTIRKGDSRRFLEFSERQF